MLSQSCPTAPVKLSTHFYLVVKRRRNQSTSMQQPTHAHMAPQWCLQIFSRWTNQAVMPSVTLNNAGKKMLFCSKTREQTKGKHEIFLKLKQRCRSQFSIVPAQEACFSSTSCSNRKARLPFLHYQGACLAAVQSPQHIRECVTLAIFWHPEEKLECFYMRELFLRLRNESTPGHIFIEHIKKRKCT